MESKIRRRVELKQVIIELFPRQYLAAEQFEMPQSTLSCIVNGYRQPSPKDLRAFKKVFGPEKFQQAFPDLRG
jgi:hypothetical protein